MGPIGMCCIGIRVILMYYILPQARSGPCLLDCIQVDLKEVDVFSARKVNMDGHNFKIVRQVRSSLTMYIQTSLSSCWEGVL